MSKKWIGAGIVLFLITLAVVIGLRMSNEAMAVVIGVIFGVAASIPTSLIVVAVAWRRERVVNNGNGPVRRPAQDALPPSVVIVNPGGMGTAGPYRQPAYLPQPDLQWGQSPRQFRVVGDPDEAVLDDERYL